jgi:hypothetical protein
MIRTKGEQEYLEAAADGVDHDACPQRTVPDQTSVKGLAPTLESRTRHRPSAVSLLLFRGPFHGVAKSINRIQRRFLGSEK